MDTDPLDRYGLLPSTTYCRSREFLPDMTLLALNEGRKSSYRYNLEQLRGSLVTNDEDRKTELTEDDLEALDSIINNAKFTGQSDEYRDKFIGPNKNPSRLRRVSSRFLENVVGDIVNLDRLDRHEPINFSSKPSLSEAQVTIFSKICDEAITSCGDIFDPGKISPQGPIHKILQEYVIRISWNRTKEIPKHLEPLDRKIQELIQVIINNSNRFSRDDLRCATIIENSMKKWHRWDENM